MKEWLPELFGTAGYCLLSAGLWVKFDLGVALITGGVLLLALAVKAVAR
ncbi:hypothetical protein H7A76_06495 [Pseudomonas sp. MSSRFD41]|nr:hypothetical protein [Pseudomonas sp. MSSRFD41]MBC2655084.1 hypothetical protein [Pseudomonas sp. MSSRFD41]